MKRLAILLVLSLLMCGCEPAEEDTTSFLPASRLAVVRNQYGDTAAIHLDSGGLLFVRNGAVVDPFDDPPSQTPKDLTPSRKVRVTAKASDVFGADGDVRGEMERQDLRLFNR